MTQIKPHKVLLIGLGQIGMFYDLEDVSQDLVLTHARAVSFHSSFTLSAAVEVDVTRAKKFEQKYKAPVYHSLETSLIEVMPDIVIIATNSDTHSNVLECVINYSTPKIVLCEKPLALDVDEAKSMVALCKEKNVPLFVNYMRRVEPAALEIRRRIQTGEIETPLKGTCYYSKGLINNGSHFLNLMEFWLGDVEDIALLGQNNTSDCVDPELDFLVTFVTGQVVFRSAWEERYTHHSIELVSPSGRLRYENGGSFISWESVSEDSTFPGYSVLGGAVETIPTAMNQYQLHVMNQLKWFLDDKFATLCSADDALKTLTNLEKIYGEKNYD